MKTIYMFLLVMFFQHQEKHYSIQLHDHCTLLSVVLLQVYNLQHFLEYLLKLIHVQNNLKRKRIFIFSTIRSVYSRSQILSYHFRLQSLAVIPYLQRWREAANIGSGGVTSPAYLSRKFVIMSHIDLINFQIFTLQSRLPLLAHDIHLICFGSPNSLPII
jgi:hypothetical protein